LQSSKVKQWQTAMCCGEQRPDIHLSESGAHCSTAEINSNLIQQCMCYTTAAKTSHPMIKLHTYHH